MADEQAAAKERKILVAVDEGEESAYALKWCLSNIVNLDSSEDTLVLVYAKPPPAVYSSLDGTGYLFSADILSSIEKYSAEVAEHVMERAVKICKSFADVKVETKVEGGDPRDVIGKVAERLNVDLVVMGSHGYGVIKRAFLGSVSNHCAQSLKCPVLIVKMPKSDNGK